MVLVAIGTEHGARDLLELSERRVALERVRERLGARIADLCVRQAAARSTSVSVVHSQSTQSAAALIYCKSLLETHSTLVSPFLMAARACSSELYFVIPSRTLAPLLPIVPAGARALASTPLSLTARAAPESGDALPAASWSACEAPCRSAPLAPRCTERA